MNLVCLLVCQPIDNLWNTQEDSMHRVGFETLHSGSPSNLAHWDRLLAHLGRRLTIS